jgi:hypothetical protein
LKGMMKFVMGCLGEVSYPVNMGDLFQRRRVVKAGGESMTQLEMSRSGRITPEEDGFTWEETDLAETVRGYATSATGTH